MNAYNMTLEFPNRSLERQLLAYLGHTEGCSSGQWLWRESGPRFRGPSLGGIYTVSVAAKHNDYPSGRSLDPDQPNKVKA